MYEAYFGLTSLPFRLAPDASFFVETATHRAALTALQGRLADGDEFVPLVGEFGIGKTLVGRRMLHEIDRTRQVGAELSVLRADGDDVFDRVVEAFGLPRVRSVRPLENAIRQFEAIAGVGRTALLLVDDAHLLDDALLRRLRKLTAVRVNGRAALRVCLAGRSTPAFEELQRCGHSLSIGPPIQLELLNAEETHAYILDRLRRAGWQGRPEFGTATAAIHERCEGNPARINRLCGHILLHLYMQGRDDVDAAVVAAVDELMQAELRGEFATLALPPQAAATPLAAALGLHAPLADAVLPGDALMAQLIAQATAPVLTALPDDEPVEPAVESPPAVPRPSPRRRGFAQVATALALMVTGGFLWQMICNFAIAHSEATHAAARAAAPPPSAAASVPAVTSATASPVLRED